MKAAPVVEAARRCDLSVRLLHTGQHYDAELSKTFFDELGLPEPDVYLGIGSDSHARQTARIMMSFEPEVLSAEPGVVVVVGDVNSTLACALVAAKLRRPVAHVEAGLRSFDERMPEETNRLVTDHVSTLLYTTSRDADANLVREGIPAERIVFVGNTMIDTLLRFRQAVEARHAPGRLGLQAGQYGVVTLHRPENVDDPAALADLVDALRAVADDVPLAFPLHPRTARRFEDAGVSLDGARIRRLPPLGYLDFVGLVSAARLVLTDSGGVQEETTVLGIPCLTLRRSTERPVTVTHGTNRVIGEDPARIVDAAREVLSHPPAAGHAIPERWDGHAADRIAEHLAAFLGDGSPHVG